MTFKEQDYDELRKVKKEINKGIKKFIESFIESGYYCVEVEDEERIYNNNNDLRTTLYNSIKRNNFNVKVFMLNGRVYLKRK